MAKAKTQTAPTEGQVEAKPVKKPAKKTKKKDVLYPRMFAVVHDGGEGNEAPVTVEQMKDLFGWEEETEDVKFGPDFLLIDKTGKKVRCKHNDLNRPFQMSWATTLAYAHLNRDWECNGESMIIGENGRVLSAQHRGIGLVLAEQIRQQDPETWKHKWKGPVTMKTVIVYGVSEDPKVTRTLDNVRPRSLSDVLFCDPTMFGKVGEEKRKVLTKAMEHAVSLLWRRSGMADSYFITKRTHSAAIDFIERHRRLVEAVAKVHELYSVNHRYYSRLIGLGTAAGLLYLMGCSASDGIAYRSQNPRHEGDLDWSNWDAAVEFWNLFCKAEAGEDDQDGSRLQVLRDVLANMGDDTPAASRPLAKIAAVLYAWDAIKDDEEVEKEDIQPTYQEDANGFPKLQDFPAVGGIDMGEEQTIRDDEDNPTEDEPTGDDPDEEDIEEQKAKIKGEHLEEMKQMELRRKDQREELLKRRRAAKQAQKDSEEDGDEAE